MRPVRSGGLRLPGGHADGKRAVRPTPRASSTRGRSKKGLVELADGGTAFFDEIGDLPLEMQAELLRLIQEGEFRAVDRSKWRQVDLRVISATDRN